MAKDGDKNNAAGTSACSLRGQSTARPGFSRLISEQAHPEAQRLGVGASAGVLVMGSESHGLTPAVAARLTQRLHIPRGPGGGAESLNVAVSAAILLDNFPRGI